MAIIGYLAKVWSIVKKLYRLNITYVHWLSAQIIKHIKIFVYTGGKIHADMDKISRVNPSFFVCHSNIYVCIYSEPEPIRN